MHQLPKVPQDVLRAAVRSVLEQHADGPDRSALPSSVRLAEAARHSLADSESIDPEAARFMNLLEVGYLAASADGLADDERHALAEFLEEAAARVVDRDALELHFRDLDDATFALGRHERLFRVAADFETPDEREEALAFGALVSIADGVLADPEMAVLVELGAQFEMSEDEVRAQVLGVVKTIEQALAGL